MSGLVAPYMMPEGPNLCDHWDIGRANQCEGSACHSMGIAPNILHSGIDQSNFSNVYRQ
jgi:hypothetical protein